LVPAGHLFRDQSERLRLSLSQLGNRKMEVARHVMSEFLLPDLAGTAKRCPNSSSRSSWPNIQRSRGF
jgi:hypothetical protein